MGIPSKKCFAGYLGEVESEAEPISLGMDKNMDNENPGILVVGGLYSFLKDPH